MKLSREERETHIWFNEADDTMEIFTESAPMIRKLHKIAPEHGATVQEAGFHGARVTLPKKALTLRKPVRQSEAQKQASAERLRNLQTRGEKTTSDSEMTQDT